MGTSGMLLHANVDSYVNVLIRSSMNCSRMIKRGPEINVLIKALNDSFLYDQEGTMD